jgi:hypothetical protein
MHKTEHIMLITTRGRQRGIVLCQLALLGRRRIPDRLHKGHLLGLPAAPSLRQLPRLLSLALLRSPDMPMCLYRLDGKSVVRMRADPTLLIIIPAQRHGQIQGA